MEIIKITSIFNHKTAFVNKITIFECGYDSDKGYYTFICRLFHNLVLVINK